MKEKTLQRKPVTPSVIEEYLSNHSHFVCSRGFQPNASQENGRGLRVHIFGRAIRMDDEVVERSVFPSFSCDFQQTNAEIAPFFVHCTKK